MGQIGWNLPGSDLRWGRGWMQWRGVGWEGGKSKGDNVMVRRNATLVHSQLYYVTP